MIERRFQMEQKWQNTFGHLDDTLEGELEMKDSKNSSSLRNNTWHIVKSFAKLMVFIFAS